MDIENLTTSEILNMLIPAVVTALVMLVGMLWARVRAYAKSTPTTLDDKLVEAVDKVVAQVKNSAQSDRKVATPRTAEERRMTAEDARSYDDRGQ